MKLDVLFMKDSSKWVAQGVQLDIAAQGDTLRRLRMRLRCAPSSNP